MKKLFATFIGLMAMAISSQAQDLGWPRQITFNGAKLVYYQPQVDSWTNQTQLEGRMAFSLTPAGGKAVVGVVTLQAQTFVDIDTHTVTLSDLQITNTYFPSLDAATAGEMQGLLQTFLPSLQQQSISLDRLVASVDRRPTPSMVSGLNNAPPAILVSYSPAIVLTVYGDPVKGKVEDSKLEYVVNTNFPLFFDGSTSTYYLFDGKGWLSSYSLGGTWQPIGKLPKEMDKIPKHAQWAELKEFVPPPKGSTFNFPRVFYSNAPAELIEFAGTPVYSKIPGTQLVYASNTDSVVFVYSPTNTYYYLTSGRWFSAPSLLGPWTFATFNLPADFANIPQSSPVSAILASVPGTPQAEDAVLLAQVPTTATVNAGEAARNVEVSYYGTPEFKPIEGTTLYYATNTSNKVIQVGDLYYLCFQGVWFMSTTPQGPWQTATSVPQVIYTIPPSSPVYNVTYVTQVVSSPGYVTSSYTAGYLGAFIMGATFGAIIAGGTGYYYPPYVGWGWVGYPVCYPRPYTYGASSWYNPYTGRYGVGGAAYGPYGSAKWGASYNPYTGTYARGATTTTPYGRTSVGQAYNPYTGAYGATRQGSNAYSNWGSSVVSRGGQPAYTQHYANAQGAVGSMQTSAGGKAVAGAGKYNYGYAGKTASGDMYAGANGNVYKNTGNGWQKYDNGSWSSVNKPTTPNFSQANSFQNSANRSSFSGGESQSLNQDYQNRQRGSADSQSFQRAQSSWGSSGRTGESGGWGSGGWGSRGSGGGGWSGGGRSFGGGGFRR